MNMNSRNFFFDRVTALGVVHHLDDTEANKLFSIAHKALKHGGKLITMDGVLIDGQSETARFPSPCGSRSVYSHGKRIPRDRRENLFFGHCEDST
jgi:cyclopropane fatty-acyl-phospholipid synthase-like methyltransferase